MTRKTQRGARKSLPQQNTSNQVCSVCWLPHCSAKTSEQRGVLVIKETALQLRGWCARAPTLASICPGCRASPSSNPALTGGRSGFSFATPERISITPQRKHFETQVVEILLCHWGGESRFASSLFGPLILSATLKIKIPQSVTFGMQIFDIMSSLHWLTTEL